MASEPLQGLPYPLSSNAADVPADMQALAASVAPLTTMNFASAAARSAQFASAGIPARWGMLSYRQDAGINGWEYYNGDVAQWRVMGRWRAFNTLGGATSAVTFSGIPTYLRTINIQINARSDAAAAFTNVDIRIGGDSSASYRNVLKFYQAGAWGSPVVQSGVTSARIGYVNANTTAAGLFGVATLDLVGWDAPKSGALRGLSRSGYYDTASGYISAESSIDYAGASAYTSVTILAGAGNFVANSEFVLSGQE